jgi:hypothetical protein
MVRKSASGILATVLVLTSCVSCSRWAVIQRQDGSKIAGEIKRSDATLICLDSGPKPSCIRTRPADECRKPSPMPVGICSASEVAVARKEIADVSHPGLFGMVSGSILVAVGSVGVGFAVSFYSKIGCEGDICYSYRPASYQLGLPSLALLGVGLVPLISSIMNYFDSKALFERTEESSGTTVAPLALTDGDKTYWGLGLGWEW